MQGFAFLLNWSDKAYFCIAVTIYGIGMVYSLFLWRRGFRRDDWTAYSLLGSGFVFQTISIAIRAFKYDPPRCPVTNLYETLTFIIWAIVGGYLVMGLWRRLRFVGAFASPLLFVMGVFALIPGMDPDVLPGEARDYTGVWGNLHRTLGALALGAFGLSAAAAGMYLTQERDLKIHKFRAILSKLPPLQRLETAMTRLMWVGFGLLSSGIAASAAYHFQPDKSISLGEPMVIWILGMWAVYLVLIVLHWRHTQSGRRIAWGALCSFLFMILTFWGALESHLNH